MANISYYRLKGYWWEMQDDKINHHFTKGSFFEDVIDLYNFDRHFRLLVFNAIERIATMELKNQFTGQGIGNALKQYSATRDNRELLFAFKKRTLVHFAVDQDEVFMTTKLAGNRTYWL